MKYVVMFSGGIGSWASARRVVDMYGADNVICLFCDVKGDSTDPHVGEDEDTYRFIDDAIANLGCQYVRVADGRDIWQVFKDKKYLGNSRLANCSHELKQKPARKWLLENTTPEDTTIVIGIDWSETHRIAAVENAYKPYKVIFPMAEKPYMDKQQMISWAENQGIKPPRLYSLGFSHNNCGGGCVRAGQAQFRLLLDKMPERFDRWAEKEQEVRDHLGKDVSILREQVNKEKKRLPLIELKSKTQAQCDMLDIGGCGCFVDDFDMELDTKEETNGRE
jgi:hypothetical protein